MVKVSNNRQKEINKKKVYIIGSSLVLILVLLFFVFKSVCLVRYKLLVEDAVLEEDVIYINNSSRSGDINFNDIYFTNINGFLLDEELFLKNNFCKWYFLDGDRDKEWFSIGKLINQDELSIVKDKDKILDMYGINNGIDILDYYFEHKNDNLNVFSSLSKIKMKYLANLYFLNNSYSGNIYKIDGDLDGYLYKNSKYYHVILGYKDDIYSMTFSNKSRDNGYFDLEIVTDVLETVYFE